MGTPLSISSFNLSREVAFNRPTLACFLHVGQYIRTFIESQYTSPSPQQHTVGIYTSYVTLPPFQLLPLARRPEPFSHPEWLFEIKYDGFCALA